MSKLQHLIPLIERLDTAVVACVGDLILDHFVYGKVSRISPEAPIPVVRISSQRSMLGGVGNAVRNLSALGCSIRLFSVTGADAAGIEVDSLLDEISECESVVLEESERQTSVKRRYVAHGQQLLRADLETTEPLSDATLAGLLQAFQDVVGQCSVVYLSDYAKGTLGGERAAEFIRVARAAGKKVIVDPKGNDFTRYRGASLIKPNLKELAEATGMPVGNSSEQEAASRKLLEVTEAENILLTRGQAGMLLTPRDQPSREFVSLAREVYEVSGAGDTVGATLAAALGSGASVADSVELANIAAGIVVGKIGTAVVDRSELVREIELRSSIVAGEKVLERAEAVERVAMWKRMGLRVGFASGRFEALSLDHLTHFEKLRADCDRLVVGVQNEGSTAAARALILASLFSVDAVVIFDGETAESLTGALSPDVV